MRTALATLAAILIAGCTAPTPTTTLKASCDALSPVMADFGQVAPDQQRYTDYLPKVQAISDAGDADTRTALAPLLTAFTDGSKGNATALAELAVASATLVGKCQAAGSTAYGSTSPTPSTSPSTTVDPAECSPVSDQVVDAILTDSDRTATTAAAVRSGAGAWLVALKLRNGDIGVWAVDSIIDPTSILSADLTAHDVSGWGPADTSSYTDDALARAKACVG